MSLITGEKVRRPFKVVFDAIRQLMALPDKPRRSPGIRLIASRGPCQRSLSPH
jgi:hypothetical protein